MASSEWSDFFNQFSTILLGFCGAYPEPVEESHASIITTLIIGHFSQCQTLFASLRPGTYGIAFWQKIFMEIKEAKYLISSPSVDESPKPDRPEIAFIGRSNVGKSSLINMLCNNSRLAKTSATPGKTQLINHFEFKSSDSTSTGASRGVTSWYLVDLPGYGFAKVSQSSRRRWEQMIEGYIRKRKNLVTLFVLIDSRHGPQKIDLDFINRLGEWQTSFALVFTKADKNKPQATAKNVNLFMQALQEYWEAPPNFFISSAVTKQGREEILNFINQLKTVT